MKQIDLLIPSFVERFKARIPLLVIEDRAGARKMFRSLLCSPLLRIDEAVSFSDAKRLLSSSNPPWHCWIVDIELGDGSGLDIMQSYPNFPFKIVVSGLRSMSIASEATRTGGAFRAFDKDDPLLVKKHCYDIYDLAAIGYLLNGQCPDRENIFFSLIENPGFEVVEDWANGNIMVPRRIEQMCRLYANTSPAKFMKMFHCLSYVLGCTGIDQGRHHYAKPEWKRIARTAFESVMNEWDAYESFFNGI